MKRLLTELRRWNLQRTPRCHECDWNARGPRQQRRLRKPVAIWLANHHSYASKHRVAVSRSRIRDEFNDWVRSYLDTGRG